MRVYSVVIANEDKAYSDRLKNYICERENSRIKFVGNFDDEESFKNRVARRRADILLSTFKMYEIIKSTPAINNFKTVVLLKDDVNEETDISEKIETISKYSAANSIVSKIIEIYEKEHPTEKLGRGDCKIIGFYSVVAGSGKTLSAIHTAYALSEAGKNVLYLNLEDIPSTELYFTCQQKNGMANLLMALGKKDKKLFLEKLKENMEDECGGKLHYISPCEYIVDPMYVGIDDWMFAFSALRTGGNLDYIIVDFSSKFDEKIIAQLALCDRIIFLSGSDKLAKLREESFFKMLEHGAGLDFYMEDIVKMKNESAKSINKNSGNVREIVKMIKSLDNK